MLDKQQRRRLNYVIAAARICASPDPHPCPATLKFECKARNCVEAARRAIYTQDGADYDQAERLYTEMLSNNLDSDDE